MSLSSNALFHLTDSKEKLKGILSEGFKIKDCAETLVTAKGKWLAAVPMVSFCDIPFSEIKNHLASYGNYGIALSVEWRRKKGLNPVLYIDTESTLGGGIRQFAGQELMGKLPNDFDQRFLPLVELLRYSKNYEGELNRRSGAKVSKYRFSDEREWRYVPSPSECQAIYSLKDYDDSEKRKK